VGKYPTYNCRQLERRLHVAWHPGDVPRGIIADIVEDLGISRDDFYFKKF
jgi:hypothetical protein